MEHFTKFPVSLSGGMILIKYATHTLITLTNMNVTGIFKPIRA
jgi:hypothetical protein